MLKSKKVVIVQSDFRALEPFAVGKYLSHRWGWGRENRVESASKWGRVRELERGTTWWAGPSVGSQGPVAGIGLLLEYVERAWNVS